MGDENTQAPAAVDATAQQLANSIKASLAQAITDLTQQAPEAASQFVDKYAPMLVKYALAASAAETTEQTLAAQRTLKALKVSALQDAGIMGVKLEQGAIQQFWSILSTAAAFTKLLL